MSDLYARGMIRKVGEKNREISEQLKDKASKNNLNERGVSITDFLIVTEISHEVAFQRASDYVRNLAIASTFKNVPSIRIPTGEYVINNKVVLSPYVKLKAEGLVRFRVTHNGTAFHIMPSENDPTFETQSTTATLNYFLNKNSWTRAKYFDGSNGVFVFTSQLDKTTSNTVAIEIGITNSVRRSDMKPVSRYIIENVNIFGFNKAIKHNGIDVYLGTYKNLHLENNYHHVSFESSISSNASVNSGENFTFEGCIFAHATSNSFLITISGMEVTVENSSFDFNASGLFKTTMTGVTIRLNSCYIEKTRGEQLVYECHATYNGARYGRNAFYIKNIITFYENPSVQVKNIPYDNNQYINLHVDIDGIEFRYAFNHHTNPYNLSNRFMLQGDGIYLYGKKIFNVSAVRSLPYEKTNLLRNGNFSLSTIRTDLMTVNTMDLYWYCFYRQGFSTPTITANGIDASNCIQFDITNTTTNTITFKSKHFYNVDAGDILLMSLLYKTDKVISTSEVIYKLECYDAENIRISDIAYYDFLSSDTELTDSDSNSYRMTRNNGVLIIPSGTVKVKPVFVFNKLQGSFLCVDDIYLSKVN